MTYCHIVIVSFKLIITTIKNILKRALDYIKEKDFVKMFGIIVAILLENYTCIRKSIIYD